jgi:hypothetical protein
VRLYVNVKPGPLKPFVPLAVNPELLPNIRTPDTLKMANVMVPVAPRLAVPARLEVVLSVRSAIGII